MWEGKREEVGRYTLEEEKGEEHEEEGDKEVVVEQA